MKVGLLFLVAFAVILPSALVGLSISDEGFIVTGAKMTLAGQLPYRDFFSLYGPAQYYLVGSLFALFGEDLLVSRIAHATMMATLAATIFALSATSGHRRGWLPYAMAAVCIAMALAARPNPLYPAIPATFLILISAVPIGRWAIRSDWRELLPASIAIGIAATFRWDFGVVGLAAATGIVASLGFAMKERAAKLFGLVVATAGPALLIAASAYVPLLAVSDPARWYREVLHYGLFEFAENRGIEFVRPTYWSIRSSLRSGDALQLCEALFKVYVVAAPFVLAPLALGIALVRIKRDIGDRDSLVAHAQSIFLALVCLGLLNQARVRPNLWQCFPAAVASLPLLPFVLARLDRSGATRRMRFIAGAIALATVPVFATMGTLGLLRAFDSSYVSLDVPRARLIRHDHRDSQYSELISFLREISIDGEAIYSGVQDHSKLFINDSLVYFLANRPPATRFVQMDPGIANTESGQRELRADLECKRVRVLVLLEMESGEDNMSSRSNGVELLDDFIRETYREARRFGPYKVMLRREFT